VKRTKRTSTSLMKSCSSARSQIIFSILNPKETHVDSSYTQAQLSSLDAKIIHAYEYNLNI